MAQAVVQVGNFEGIGDALRASLIRLGLKAPSREIVILGVILCVLQILDGVLTGIGIHTYGITAEGNLFLRSLMEQWGANTTLLVTKSFSILIVCALCMLSNIVTWIGRAMKAVIAVYLVAAVVPWTLILLNAPA